MLDGLPARKAVNLHIKCGCDKAFLVRSTEAKLQAFTTEIAECLALQ